MSDLTLEQLQTENAALKTKNTQLLDELKRAKASKATEALQEQIDTLESQNTELASELRKYTFDTPVNDAFESVSGAGTHFRRAFEDHFTIEADEEGRFVIHEDGVPLSRTEKVGTYGKEEVPLELNGSNIRDLIFERELKELDFYLIKPQGSGAPGNNSSSVRVSNKEPEKEPDSANKGHVFGLS